MSVSTMDTKTTSGCVPFKHDVLYSASEGMGSSERHGPVILFAATPPAESRAPLDTSRPKSGNVVVQPSEETRTAAAGRRSSASPEKL